VGTDRHVAIFSILSRDYSENVADRINVHVLEAEFAEAILHPVRAGSFAKGGSGDARKLHLSFLELDFFATQPCEGFVYGRHLSQPHNALLGGTSPLRFAEPAPLRQSLDPEWFYARHEPSILQHLG